MHVVPMMGDDEDDDASTLPVSDCSVAPLHCGVAPLRRPLTAAWCPCPGPGKEDDNGGGSRRDQATLSGRTASNFRRLLLLLQ